MATTATMAGDLMGDESVLEIVVDDDDDEIVEEVIDDDDDVVEVIEEEDEESFTEEEVIDEDDPNEPEPIVLKAAPRRKSMIDIAKVDMNCLVVKKIGLEVDRDEEHGLGRIVRTNQDLGTDLMYQSVLRELPALVCNQEDYADFMQNFLEAPALHQFGIMDMFCQPLDSPMGKALHEQARLLYLLGIMEDTSGGVLKTIHQLLTILQTNGQQYNRGGNSLTALAIFGSKFAHSCVPNIGYSPEAAPDKALEFKLIKPVKKGEMVAFSYLTDLLETPTNERRQILMETKSFWCQCPRCTGKDYSRCMPCPTSKEVVPCQYSPGNDAEACKPFWECPVDGVLESDELESVEREFAKVLQMVSRTVERARVFDAHMNAEYNSPTTLKEIVQECESELSPTHHLTMKALRLLFTVATKHAYLQIFKRSVFRKPLDKVVFSLMRTSVIAGYKLVLAGECVAAASTDCSNTQDETNLTALHEPQYDRALPMSHITDNLLHIPIFWWPSIALTMTTRYMPILRARFGDTVDHIEEGIVQKWKDIKCMECGTYWNAFTGATTKEDATQ